MVGILTGNIVDNSHSKNLHQIFEENYATCLPKLKSLHEANGNDYTYSDLKKSTDQLSQNFHRIGLTKGLTVGIFIANGVERIATMLALAKLGVVFFPLDPVLKKEKIEQILSQCPPAMIIIGKENDYMSLWQQYNISINTCCLNDIEGFGTKENDLQQKEVLPNDLFCILFTSGSTGVSKGVMLTHHNFINRLSWYWQEVPYTQNDIACSKTSFLFIDYMVETFAPILKCIPCVFMQRQHYENLKVFLKHLEEYQITRLFVVPSLLKLLVTLPDDNQINLTHVVCSGESLPNDLATTFVKKFPRTSLYNYYGTTELPEVLVATFSLEKMSSNGNSVIGFPIDNTIIYVVKDDGTLITDLEESGELWVAGANVSIGYINNPEKTNDAYVKNPFTNDVQFKTVYKTGDYGKITPNGVEYLGRRDDFIKVRGHKVNLKDVEHAIKEILPSTQVSVLSKFIEVRSQMQIFAFILSSPLSEDELMTLLMNRLPHFMRPRIVLIDEMPLTPTGKINRQLLFKNIPNVTSITRFESQSSHLSMSEKVRIATSHVLNIPADKIDDSKSFFQLGGDSLTVFLLLNELTKLGLNLKLENILQSMSLQEITRNNDTSFFLNDNNDNIKVVSFSDLSNEELTNMVDQLVDTFETSDIFVNFHKRKGFYIRTSFHEMVFDCKINYPTYGAAVKVNGVIVGATINAPINAETDMSISAIPEELNELFKYCVSDVIERLQGENHNILNNILVYIDQNIPNHIGPEVLLLLSKEITSIGKSHGHTVSVTIDVNPALQILDLDVHGHTLAKVVHPHTFYFNKKYPYEELDKDFRICVILEYFN